MQVLYATACCGDHAVGDGSFTPLQINYAERFSAAGRTRCAPPSLTSCPLHDTLTLHHQMKDLVFIRCRSETHLLSRKVRAPG